MENKNIHAVTGAFGYSGKYITQKLLSENVKVITLTNSVNRPNPFGDKVKAFPFNFDNKDELCKTFENVKVLYNTYWVRFNHSTFKHSTAVENTLKMFDAAKIAGVEKIVHVSITNPSKDSKLEYFSGKAILEEALINSGISYSILRPTVIFGKEDILINNIAWIIRKMPLMGVFGDGKYKLQPIYVEDLAELAVSEGKNRENKIIDAIGPETFEYKELVEKIAEIIGVKRKIISVSDSFGYFVGKLIGWLKNDYVITKPEIEGLKADLLYTKSLPAGKTKLTEWIEINKNTLGKVYSNELNRRKETNKTYEELK
jgi:NADH dehydrogenase